MVSDLITRLREIAAERQRLADEEADLLHLLAGDATPSPASVPLLVKNLVPLKKAAGEFGVSEKRMRRWAEASGARRMIAGRILVDMSKLKRKVWPDLAG